jgi:hypothetical protein
MSTETKLDTFTLAYIEAALWSSTTDDDTPMDRDYSRSDISPETLAKMIADCAWFQAEQAEWITDEYCNNSHREWGTNGQAGHDLWLTRNGHGCGFWDGDWEEPAATKLDEAAKAMGEVNLYVGDDGRIYA